jgi:glyoxylase-like metal-dependent hydrolase (beta-lactamase superfamily II)
MNTPITIKIGMTKFFMLKTENGFLLIDTVPESYRDKFYDALKNHAIQEIDIIAILLTHHHGDHTGMIYSLLETNPKIQLIYHSEESQALSSGKNRMNFYRSRMIENVSLKQSAKEQDFAPIQKRDNDRIIGETRSSVLRTYGIDAEVFLTPGHTPGSLSVLFDGGTLVAGDTFSNVSLTPFRFNPLPFVYDDKEQLLASWKLLYSLNPKIVIPSHGRAFRIQKIAKYLL